jgi:UDP-N-acetylglucosamine--N-acetylmuramyl-(pentapeptide) pyrophosphoryl-undecaprenol N-acetylglucosamine transferase
MSATRCGAWCWRGRGEYVAPGEGSLEILVIGGSQGARILSDVVPGASRRCPRTCARGSA